MQGAVFARPARRLTSAQSGQPLLNAGCKLLENTQDTVWYGACSQGYPTEVPVALAQLCQEYTAVCGAYVGRRADDEHVCGP
jgi:hypothetical protein